MLNKIATAFGVLIAVALGVFIAPYFHKFISDQSKINVAYEENNTSDQISESPSKNIENDIIAPIENVSIQINVVEDFFTGKRYEGKIKNTSDQPIQIYQIQINNRESCYLNFKHYNGQSLSKEDHKYRIKRIEMGVAFENGTDVGAMTLKSISDINKEIVEKSGPKTLQVGESYDIYYPTNCGEPVIIKTETNFQVLETRF
jgi:hypothetical protein